MNRHDLIQCLEQYTTGFAEEKQFIEEFLDLLDHPRAYHRDHLPGHMTGSAFIVDESLQFVLLVHHAKLERWLQPGGHADGDENILHVALREAVEETGIKNVKLLTPNVFDIDIHTIPARKEFPGHFHYDIRFLMQAHQHEKIIVSEESKDVVWIPLHEVGKQTNGNASLQRMMAKVRSGMGMGV